MERACYTWSRINYGNTWVWEPYLRISNWTERPYSTYFQLHQTERFSDKHKRFRKLDMIKLFDTLRNITDWSPSSSDVNQYWSKLLTILQDKMGIDLSFAHKKPTQRIHFQIRNLTKKWTQIRNAAWEDHQRNTLPETEEKYQLLQNNVSLLIKENKGDITAKKNGK